jgi:hypothetical protein
MALESGQYISDFVISNPAPGDPKSQGDDHLRLIKTVIQTTFPAFKGVMPIAHDQVASKDFVNQTAFSAALPAQPGGTTTYQLTSLGGSASWTPRRAIFDDATRLAQAQATALCF